MMDGKTYIVRSLKYLVWLLLLFTLVFTLMLATGTSRADAGRDLAELFGSQRGRLMLAVIVVVAAFYPKFGFARRTVAADFTGDRELILSTFRANRFFAGSGTGRDDDLPGFVAAEKGFAAVGRPDRRNRCGRFRRVGRHSQGGRESGVPAPVAHRKLTGFRKCVKIWL